MPERRSEERPESDDRRSFPRPPLWLNLLLLVVAVIAIFLARSHRRSIDTRMVHSLSQSTNVSGQMLQIRNELASLDLNEDALARELETRVAFAERLQGDEFHISIDTSKKKLFLLLGNDVVRDAAVTVGPPLSAVAPSGKKWTFVPLLGEFEIQGKEEGLAWRVSEWLYASQGQEPPADRPVIADGMGKYVIVLPNNYIIHSPPSPESPMKGPKPGSFMVPEEDLRAIWPRVQSGMHVFIF